MRTALLSRAEHQLRKLRGGATDVGGDETVAGAHQLGGNYTAEDEDKLELPSLMVGGTEYLYDESGECFGVKHVLFSMDGEPWGVYDPATGTAEEVTPPGLERWPACLRPLQLTRVCVLAATGRICR